jgi:hypothetical protein
MLLSGLVLAEVSGRAFTMLWPVNNACAARFGDLFANDWHVVDVDHFPDLPVMGERIHGAAWRDLLAAPEHDLVVHGGYPLVRPAQFPAHSALWPCYLESVSLLRPASYVMQAVDSFRCAHFRPTMIGVHLRRGDFHFLETRDNTASALTAVEAFLRQAPDAGIFLSTDDGAVNQDTGRPSKPEHLRERFRRTYGDRVVYTEPRSLDRRQPKAVQDALADFMLLRSTDYFVGTRYSSFSEMAALGRSIPVVMCDSGSIYRNKRLLATVTGIYPALKVLGLVQFHRNLGFGYLWRYYRPGLAALPGRTVALLRDAGALGTGAAHRGVTRAIAALRGSATGRLLRRVRIQGALAVKQRFPRFFAGLRWLVRAHWLHR